MELVIATNNEHKVTEIKAVLPKQFMVYSLREVGIEEEIPEEQETLQGNALQKARYIYEKYGKNCFADDTGLEVLALGNAPGVYSARYAGEGCKSSDNIVKLLQELKGVSERSAQFRTVIALILDGKEFLFEGIVNSFLTFFATGGCAFTSLIVLFFVPQLASSSKAMPLPYIILLNLIAK